jgi:repressor LexA
MYNNLKKLREQRGFNMKEIAIKLGIPYTTYVGYEKGEREPNSDVLIKIANYYNTSVDFILGVTTTQDIFSIPNIIPIPKTKNVPLLGTIACGEPILAEENIENYVTVDMKANVDFALKCKGDSMINARIFDGDIVYIHSQPDVENGEIAAVLIDNEATLKKVHKYTNKLVLSPCNPMYDDLVYTEEQLNDIRILGKAVIFVSTVR